MRTRLFMIMLAVVLSQACSNKMSKSEVVDRQRQLKDSITLTKMNLDIIEDEYGGVDTTTTMDRFDIYMEKSSEFHRKLIRFEREYDSLEFELKKF